MLGALLLIALAAPAHAQSGTDFKGETISIQIGYGPGGGYDTYGRALARHLGRFIPGNPTWCAEEHAGRGLAARRQPHLQPRARATRVEIGIFSASTAMEPLMGNDQAKFDATKFGWLGSMNQDISFCGVWVAPGIPTSIHDMLKKDAKEMIFGSAGPGRDQPPASAHPARTSSAPISA